MQKNDLPANIFGKTNRIRGGIADPLLFRAAGLSILLAIPLATAYSVLLESFGASTMRIRALFFVAIALVLAQASFGGTASSCSNESGAPFNIGGTLYAYFDCSLYNDVSTYSFNLAPLMLDGGALLSNNAAGAGYFVVTNVNPSTLADNSTGLFNPSYWQTVLYFPVDTVDSTLLCTTCYESDSLTVDWPGAFPLASTVQSLDQTIVSYYNTTYGTGTASDLDFFIQGSVGYKTVWQPSGVGVAGDEYDIYNTPEPGTIVLLGSSLALLSGVFLKRRRTAGRAA